MVCESVTGLFMWMRHVFCGDVITLDRYECFAVCHHPQRTINANFATPAQRFFVGNVTSQAQETESRSNKERRKQRGV